MCLVEMQHVKHTLKFKTLKSIREFTPRSVWGWTASTRKSCARKRDREREKRKRWYGRVGERENDTPVCPDILHYSLGSRYLQDEHKHTHTHNLHSAKDNKSVYKWEGQRPLETDDEARKKPSNEATLSSNSDTRNPGSNNPHVPAHNRTNNNTNKLITLFLAPSFVQRPINCSVSLTLLFVNPWLLENITIPKSPVLLVLVVVVVPSLLISTP